jgi:hypothetical protein
VPEQPTPRVEVSAESLGLFATKVQPILMNACVSCHTGGRGGSFQLTRVTGPGLANRRSLEKNLAAVMAQINSREPAASKLLSKAVSVHGTGMTQAPLKGRQAPAFHQIEHWVTRTVETNPQLAEESHASVSPTAQAPPAAEPRWGADRESKPTTARPRPTPPVVSPTAPAVPPPTPPTRPGTLDPVDPEGFNREFHPPRKSEPDAK